MAIIQRKNPREERRVALHRDFDDLIDRMFRGWPESALWNRENLGEFVPALDMDEDDVGWTVRAELAGVPRDAVEIDYERGTLTIRGEKKEESKREGKGWSRTERSYGTFLRQVRLPDQVDEGRITAEMDNGLLVIKLPKSGEAKEQRRRIQIRG